MGNVIKFRRPPRNRGQFRGQGACSPTPPNPKRPKRRGKLGVLAKTFLLTVALPALAIMWWGIDQSNAAEIFTCNGAKVIDGDTFRCGDRRIRLQGIDAPETPGHCRRGRECAPGDPQASTENLRRLIAGGNVQCLRTDTDVYGRTVARCKSAMGDLSCKQLEGGFAIRRYAPIDC